MKILFFSLLMTFAFLACKQGKDHSHDKMEGTEMEADMSGPEYTSAYVCPMHCEGSGSDKPGECPVCGMDYVMNENMDETHDDHSDHDH